MAHRAGSHQESPGGAQGRSRWIALGVAGAVGILPLVAFGLGNDCNLRGCPVGCPAGGCAAPLAIQHARSAPCVGSPEGGSFDLRGTQFERTCGLNSPGCPTPVVPPLRFWEFDSNPSILGATGYENANFGCRVNTDLFVNASIDLGVVVPDGHWLLFQTNWLSPDIDGCLRDSLSKNLRTVAEVSDVDDSQGGAFHGAWYIITSTDENGDGYDFDRIRNADIPLVGGDCAASMPQRPVPGLTIVDPPRTAPCAQTVIPTLVERDSRNPAYITIKVAFVDPTPAYFSEIGMNDPLVPLISGWEVVYAEGPEPVSSDRAIGGWTRAYRLDSDGAAKPMEVVPFGTRRASVSLPVNGLDKWLAVRLSWTDCVLNGSHELRPWCVEDSAYGGWENAPLGSDVGGHCGPVHED